MLFEFKYQVAVCTGISDYVMERLFCSVLGYINVSFGFVMMWNYVHNCQKT